MHTLNQSLRVVTSVVIGDDLRVDLEVTQQGASDGDVFGCDQVDVCEDSDRAKCDVFEVADWRCDDVEEAWIVAHVGHSRSPVSSAISCVADPPSAFGISPRKGGRGKGGEMQHLPPQWAERERGDTESFPRKGG